MPSRSVLLRRAAQCLTLALLSFSTPLAAQPASPLTALARTVERDISGDRAFATVRFVEQYFRLPGNRGFDASIDTVASLLQAAGYVRQDRAKPTDRMVYRVESRPMRELTWTPDSASLTIAGRRTPLMRFATNKNMIAINSYSTPAGGVTAEVVDVGSGADSVFARVNVRGRIVLAEGNARMVFPRALRNGAAGVLFVQKLPAYNQQEKNTTAVQFSSVPRDSAGKGWQIFLSKAAADSIRRAMLSGPLTVTVHIATRVESRPERTVVAEILGAVKPAERFVYSAHVQEPGANDNASGVGLLAEMARVAASMVRAKTATPARTLTFLWGDEIRATARFLSEDTVRRAGVKWGMSLDMVGENTALTGGSFLIEKMPDPSAVWVRGADQHSEWGGRPIPASEIRAYWFNDFVRQRCLDRASRSGWTVKSNPFEGGSDHTPFLDAKIPAVLLWHFTDQFYHTDRDRIEMVSRATLANVGSCALTTGLLLAAGAPDVARAAVSELATVAEKAIRTQAVLSDSALRAGGDAKAERVVLETWRDYYVAALAKLTDMLVSPVDLSKEITAAQARVRAAAEQVIK
ncbi:MAG: M28 family peptidase [Gemmatimonadota bacterium]